MRAEGVGAARGGADDALLRESECRTDSTTLDWRIWKPVGLFSRAEDVVARASSAARRGSVGVRVNRASWSGAPSKRPLPRPSPRSP